MDSRKHNQQPNWNRLRKARYRSAVLELLTLLLLIFGVTTVLLWVFVDDHRSIILYFTYISGYTGVIFFQVCTSIFRLDSISQFSISSIDASLKALVYMSLLYSAVRRSGSLLAVSYAQFLLPQTFSTTTTLVSTLRTFQRRSEPSSSPGISGILSRKKSNLEKWRARISTQAVKCLHCFKRKLTSRMKLDRRQVLTLLRT